MSKRRKTGITILCLLGAALLILFDRSFVRHNWRPQPKSDEQTEAHDLEKYHAQTFAIAKVIDGDTIDIDIPDGTYPARSHLGHPAVDGQRHKTTRIRLLGIDAPEAHSEQFGKMYFALEATKFTKELILGKDVTVYLDNPNPTRGKYGRLLAYVKLPDGRFLNEVLLTDGFVYADLRFSHSFFNKYKQLEAGARSFKKGLWENVTREQLPSWLQRMEPKLLN